jgi:predicted alpha/beta-fold hydrolase
MGQNLARTVGRHIAPREFLSKAELAKLPVLPTEQYDLATPYGDLADEVVRLKRKGRHLRLREFDELITSKLGGLRKEDGGVFPFKGADDYYAHASSKAFIGRVKRPLLGINAFDDPIIHGCECELARP